MEKNEKMNVLVLGISGAGKSTLIKSISGMNVITGVGEGNTQKIKAYESDTWPLVLIDTKGFEYSYLEQIKTIMQIKKYTREQIKIRKKDKNAKDVGIDAIWYCIEGTSRRTFAHNIGLMNNAIKGWKNVPVFAVITKSYSETDIPENISAVKEAFSKYKNVNLKGIIPVVASEYKVNDNNVVLPMGLEELCTNTIKCMSESKQIKESSLNNMIFMQKRYTAHSLTVGASITGAGIAAIPFNFADSELLVPLEIGLTTGILKIYNISNVNGLAKSIVGSNAITFLAKKAVTGLKTIPGVGDAINAVVAGIIIFALGEGVIFVSEEIYTGRIDENDIDKVNEAVSNSINDNPILNTAINYFNKNKNNLSNKKTKDILNDIIKESKK